MDYRSLPKVELHCHLEACFRAQTVMEIGRSVGLDIPQDPAVFRRDWLLSRPLANLETALARFVDIQRVWCSEEVIERLAFEACEDARAQNIRVMEFRYAPDFIAAGKHGLDFETIHAAIVAGIERARHDDLAVGLIGIVQKTLPLAAAARTVDFMVEHADSFVGLDFADRDTRPIRDYAPLVERARRAGLRLTVHAGEEPGSAAQVRDAIEQLGAERIGHGIHIVQEPDVLELVRQSGVVLEVCPTSNWLTSSVPSTAAHPIRRLMDEGVAVTVNSDDPSLFGIDLCHEYDVLGREHGYSAAEFAACNRTALAGSFLAEDAKARAWRGVVA
ncbi:MAG TPA: adenosine deaminase [Woeseiaceae bacterium]|nr:adenosine deaminase [Woeseiaceae bacterium]